MKRQLNMAANDEELSLAPKLRFPELRDEPWEEKKFGDYLEESRTKGSRGDVARKLTVKLWGKGVFEKNESLRGSESTQYYRRKAGQFIYSKLDFLNQAFGVIPANLDGFESTVDLPCFDISELLHPTFLLEYVKRPAFYEKFGEIADGGRKAKRIQPESFLSFPILVPQTFREQQKIAECLSTLDELMAAESQKLDALKAHKKGLMQQLFPREGETLPRLRFPEFGGASEWSVLPMGELLSGKPEYGVNAPAVPYSESLPTYLRITDIDDDGRYLKETKASVDVEATEDNQLRAGDIVLARTGASVGKSYRYQKTDGPLVFAGFLIRIRPDQEKVDSGFLANFLRTNQYWSWVRVTSTRSGQPGLNGSEYASFEVPIPPPGQDGLIEQQRIASCLSSLDDLIAVQSDHLEALKTHKKGLMQQLFPSPASP